MTASPTFASSPPDLCVADDAAFWPWRSSPVLAGWADPGATVVVVPLCGMADWGLGHPLDAEETVLMNVLRGACASQEPDRRPLVLPPLRFVAGPDPACAFAVDPPTAHAMIAEVAASVAAAGFRRIVLLNSSPWNEELCSAAARDLRVSRDLQMFQIHLSALGLDFHPVRSRSRRELQTILTCLLGTEPETGPLHGTPQARAWGDESVTPLQGPAAGLEEARADGAERLGAACGRLAKLLSDVRDYPALTVSLAPS